MTLDLYINEANDYARDIRVPLLHPHVAIILRNCSQKMMTL